jgi:rhodanese-related sulfurtransferase
MFFGMDTNSEFTDALYEQFARIGKAVASPKRLELLDLLAQGERTVETLALLTGTPVANVSQHLQVLRGARLVETRRAGTHVWYRLADATVIDLVASLRAVAERRLAEVEQITRAFLGGPDDLEPVDREELLRRVREGAVTVLDVRPIEEYAEGHLPQALSVPLEELAKRLREIPKRREVVAYCRGPYCVLALKAVEFLRAKGYRAVRLDLGVVEWKARGWRVEAAGPRAEGGRAGRGRNVR